MSIGDLYSHTLFIPIKNFAPPLEKLAITIYNNANMRRNVTFNLRHGLIKRKKIRLLPVTSSWLPCSRTMTAPVLILLIIELITDLFFYLFGFNPIFVNNKFWHLWLRTFFKQSRIISINYYSPTRSPFK